MRISDWSSDVCSSDLPHVIARRAVDSLRDPRQPAEDVAAANDEAEFVPRLFRRGDLTRDARHRLGIDPEGRFAHQDFARQLEKDAFEAGQRHGTWRNDKAGKCEGARTRSEEHTSELQSLMRISYAVFCLKKKK